MDYEKQLLLRDILYGLSSMADVAAKEPLDGQLIQKVTRYTEAWLAAVGQGERADQLTRDLLDLVRPMGGAL